jgi:5-methylcytosine-specific restriction endonuclease McrA
MAQQIAKGDVRSCPECQSSFYRRIARQKFCSITCAHRARDRILCARRRGRYVVGEPVDPMKVFERDGWRCRECRCSSPRSLRGTNDPRAPELDHIVSVADGGEHSYRNTQLLCRRCNGAKGRASRGQLVLM